MAASFTIAGRSNGFSKSDARAARVASVRAYREAMAEFAGMRTMDLWYAHLSEDDLRGAIAKFAAPAGHGKKDGKGKEGKSKHGKAAHNGGRDKDAAAELARAAKQSDKALRK